MEETGVGGVGGLGLHQGEDSGEEELAGHDETQQTHSDSNTPHTTAAHLCVISEYLNISISQYLSI